MQCYSQDVAGAQAPDRRHVLSVVEHAFKLVASDRVIGRSGDEINVQLALAAGEHHRIGERLAGIVSLCARVYTGDRYA